MRGNGEDDYEGGLWDAIRKMQKEESRLIGRMGGKRGGLWKVYRERWG